MQTPDVQQEQLSRLRHDLDAARRQQAATAEILKVISRSKFDLTSVLTTLVELARDLCIAPQCMLFLRDGDFYRCAVQAGWEPEVEQYFRDNPLPRSYHNGAGRAAITKRPVHFPDVLADPDYRLPDHQSHARYRTLLSVPLIRGDDVIGVFSLGRPDEPDPFTEQQIQLVETFADQAVIAIANVRLFEEVQTRTNELSEALKTQTATAEVLKSISRSAFDLKSVLQTLLESAARLSEADQASLTRQKGELFLRSEAYGFSEEFTRYVADMPVDVGRGTVTGRALQEAKVVHILDALQDKEYTWTEAQLLAGLRSILSVPMIRDGLPIGALTLARSDVRPFTLRQINLVQTFADQAVVAIQNAKLFDEVKDRTRALTQSLEELRGTQSKLIQSEKLASLGQLTAGIAHEIKNPLNFVNNFADLSRELIEELKEVIGSGGVSLSEQWHAEVEDLTRMLTSNLEKVAQHGRRADSIVKNMLLHSRESGGERRSVDLNALVEESLSLAYHGARAANPGFNVAIGKDLDPSVGKLELYPQEFTRVLLNLISNGFHASHQKSREGDPNFEPSLEVSTKALLDCVEIAVRDNGVGIADDVKARMFDPFFTTKPSGEGTGLGLSLSHDIVVKQHGGKIDVETKLGQFTKFKIQLPGRQASSKGVRS